MKKIFYFLIASLAFTGCEKNDGPIPKDDAPDRVPAALITKDPTGTPAIDVISPASFTGKFSVGLYFPNDIPPAKFDIVVRKNNDNGTTKVFQAAVTSFPATYTITVAQLATLFGAPVALNDNYDIGADVYTNYGKKYEAFPIVGMGYATAFQPDHPGFSPSVRYSAICQYNPASFQGNFVVQLDAWQDTNPGDIIVLTKVDNTHFSFTYPTAVNPVPIVVTVNTLDNSLSIAKQNIGTLWVYGPQYTLPNVSAGGAGNVVAPCDGTLTLNMNWGYSAGSFSGGPYTLILKKQ